jgi:hypothetical protein
LTFEPYPILYREKSLRSQFCEFDGITCHMEVDKPRTPIKEDCMGFDLRNDKGSFRLSIHAFVSILELAHRFGWNPMGTQPPSTDITGHLESGEWTGDYFSSDFQRVVPEDAERLGAALDQAISHIESPVAAIAEAPGARLHDNAKWVRDYQRVTNEVDKSLGCHSWPCAKKTESLLSEWQEPENLRVLQRFRDWIRGGFVIS